jgi:hypothetical protein
MDLDNSAPNPSLRQRFPLYSSQVFGAMVAV